MSEKTAQEQQDFKVAMQQLAAEAEKILPPLPVEAKSVSAGSKEPTPQAQPHAPSPAAAANKVKSFVDRLDDMESAVLKRLEQIEAQTEASRAAAFAEQLKRIDEQLASIRSSESVNQKLFDSLHGELLKYRDNFLHESLQKPFIHDLVYLYDHLNGLCDQLSTAAQEGGKRSRESQWRDNLENAIHALVEILHRFEVKEIEPREYVDRSCHRVVNFEPADFPEDDGRVVMRVRRGFVWRGKLIRPEEVIAKRYG